MIAYKAIKQYERKPSRDCGKLPKLQMKMKMKNQWN